MSLGKPVTHRACLYPWRVGCEYAWTTPRERLLFLSQGLCLPEGTVSRCVVLSRAPLLSLGVEGPWLLLCWWGSSQGLLDVIDADSISAAGVQEAAHPVSPLKGLLLPKPFLSVQEVGPKMQWFSNYPNAPASLNSGALFLKFLLKYS